MAQIAIVWTDGQPAVGTEYGPGNRPLCCPLCGECLIMIVEAKRGDTVLGWMLFDSDARCGHMLDASQYAMNVQEAEQGVITVEFVAVPAKETGARSEAEAKDPRTDDVRAPKRRVRKAEPSG